MSHCSVEPMSGHSVTGELKVSPSMVRIRSVGVTGFSRNRTVTLVRVGALVTRAARGGKSAGTSTGGDTELLSTTVKRMT
jgi:hypothetical protein